MKKLIMICTIVGLMVLANSVSYALPSDNFDDNLRDTSLWSLYEEDPSNVWLDETNQRLEMRSTTIPAHATALYFANGWGLSTADDFSFKTDFHNSFTSSTHAWAQVMLGLAKGSDPTTVRENNARIEAAWETGKIPPEIFNYGWSVEGAESNNEIPRGSDDGTLYLSYDASVDELYLSHTGYWKTSAWYTIAGVLQGTWGGGAVSPCLGGEVDWGAAIDSGDAYLDNFVVDSGTVVSVSVIPAPGAILLGSIGLGLIGWMRRRRTL